MSSINTEIDKLYVKSEHLTMLYDIFNQYCPNAVIWAYGNRLRGDCHDGSGLDLVVKSFGDSKCSLGELRQLLNDSNIPFLIDINEFEYLPEYFRTEILKRYVVIYPYNKS